MSSNEKYRKLFEDFEVSVDKEKLWQSVKPAIPRKRRKISWILPFWVISMVGSIGVTYQWTKNKYLDQQVHATMLLSNSKPNTKDAYISNENTTNIHNSKANRSQIGKNKEGNQNINKSIVQTEQANNTSQNKSLSESIVAASDFNNVDLPIFHLDDKIVNYFDEKIEFKTSILDRKINSFEKLPNLSNYLNVAKNSIEINDYYFVQKSKSPLYKQAESWIYRIDVGSFRPQYTSTNGNNRYEEELNSSTLGLEYFGADVVGSIYRKRGFNVSTGMQYSRFTTRLTNSTINTVSSTKDGIETTTINASGQNISNMGRVHTHISEISTYKWHTVYQNIDWLWDISYRTELSKKWAFSFHFFPSIRIVAWEEGGILTDDNRLNKFNSGDSPLKSDVFSMNFGSYLQYKINRDISIMVGSRYIMRQYSLDAYGIEKSIRSINLSLGIIQSFK